MRITPARREELQRIVKAYAFDAAFGDTDMLTALTRAWTFAESREEGRYLVKSFQLHYPRLLRRAVDATLRIAAKEREFTAHA